MDAKWRMLAVLAVGALVACGSGGNTGAPADGGSGGGTGVPADSGAGGFPTEVTFATVEKSSYSGIASRRDVVIDNDADWAVLWASHVAMGEPTPPRPAIDFARFQVLGIFLGTRGNGCYGVDVLRVADSPTARIVEYRETVPGPGAICLAVIVTPAHLVQVPRSPLPVEFRAL